MKRDLDLSMTSVCFAGNIRKLTANPFDTETPFGKVVIVAVGNVFKERDEFEELLNCLSDSELEELKAKAAERRERDSAWLASKHAEQDRSIPERSAGPSNSHELAGGPAHSDHGER